MSLTFWKSFLTVMWPVKHAKQPGKETPTTTTNQSQTTKQIKGLIIADAFSVKCHLLVEDNA